MGQHRPWPLIMLLHWCAEAPLNFAALTPTLCKATETLSSPNALHRPSHQSILATDASGDGEPARLVATLFFFIPCRSCRSCYSRQQPHWGFAHTQFRCCRKCAPQMCTSGMRRTSLPNCPLCPEKALDFLSSCSAVMHLHFTFPHCATSPPLCSHLPAGSLIS